MKQFIWGAVFGVSCTMAIGGLAAVSPETEQAYKALDLFADAVERAHANYIQPISVPDLVDKALDGMASRLDPHSAYIDSKSYSQMQSPGPRAGIGLELTQDFGMIRVISPIDGAPAAAAGIRPGDAILAINDVNVAGMTLNQVIDLLRGPEKSQVSITLQHAPTAAPRTITLTRAIVSVNAVKFERKGDIGYIRPSGFTEGTAEELERGVRALRRTIGSNIKGYVLDLRNNPGGLLDQAIQISDDFLVSGEIVSTRGRNARDTAHYGATSGDVADGKPVVVLVNGGTGSGAEIVAAALQDHKRAVILGMKSFGVGTIQTLIPLKSGGALRLTTARFYRPSGSSIQAVGVTPDILVAQSATEDEQSDWRHPSELQLPGHLSGEDAKAGASAILRPEPSAHSDDFQLETAIARLNALPAAKP